MFIDEDLEEENLEELNFEELLKERPKKQILPAIAS